MTNNSYLETITKIRKQTDHFFKFSDDSPLAFEQKQSFTGLSYYPIDENFLFEINLQKEEDPKEVTILATKGDERRYLRYGLVELELENTVSYLTIFKSLDDEYFFVPFKDKTTGVESYGGGRYVEIESLNASMIRLDFNLAYLPYCAMNDRFSCTMVPSENILGVRIPAGQMNFIE